VISQAAPPMSPLDGLPVVGERTPANLDERESASPVLFARSHDRAVADKGFIGADQHADIAAATGARIFTPRHHNQHDQNLPAFDRWLNVLRERIAGAFHELKHTVPTSTICHPRPFSVPARV